MDGFSMYLSIERRCGHFGRVFYRYASGLAWHLDHFPASGRLFCRLGHYEIPLFLLQKPGFHWKLLDISGNPVT
jgi:hypothetical protein